MFPGFAGLFGSAARVLSASYAMAISRILTWLVRGIPALHDLIEFLRQILRGVTREPSGLHHAAAGGRGRLLILAGEIVGTKAAAQGFERLQRLACGMKDIASLPLMRARAERAFDDIGLIFFGDRRERNNLPGFSAGELSLAKAWT